MDAYASMNADTDVDKEQNMDTDKQTQIFWTNRSKLKRIFLLLESFSFEKNILKRIEANKSEYFI
jgi:hypothetical protein